MRFFSGKKSRTQRQNTSSQRKTVVISGIAPGDSGTGRLIQFLADQLNKHKYSGRILLAPPRLSEFQMAIKGKRPRQLWRLSIRALNCMLRLVAFLPSAILDKKTELILFHPQAFGFQWALSILSWKRGSAKLFLLDSSFFCVRSYNHLPSEFQPCFACVGGNFESIRANQCLPFPQRLRDPQITMRRLFQLVAKKKVALIAQNKNQFELAKKHFGNHIELELGGLWTSDFESMRPIEGRYFSRTKQNTVVLHSYNHPAKGVFWLIELARELPNVQFVFPFSVPTGLQVDPPANIQFSPMTWDSGLQDLILKAHAVLVPSLWSAPIEGALVKSIACNRKVFAVKNPTSFADEIPDAVVCKLNVNPQKAAAELNLVLKQDRGSPQRDIWIGEFKKNRERFLKCIFNRHSL